MVGGPGSSPGMTIKKAGLFCVGVGGPGSSPGMTRGRGDGDDERAGLFMVGGFFARQKPNGFWVTKRKAKIR